MKNRSRLKFHMFTERCSQKKKPNMTKCYVEKGKIFMFLVQFLERRGFACTRKHSFIAQLYARINYFLLILSREQQ